MLIVDLVKIPVLVSLSVVATILVLSVLASLWYSRKRKDVTPGH
jgi:tellurite resistance protein TerC